MTLLLKVLKLSISQVHCGSSRGKRLGNEPFRAVLWNKPSNKHLSLGGAQYSLESPRATLRQVSVAWFIQQYDMKQCIT